MDYSVLDGLLTLFVGQFHEQPFLKLLHRKLLFFLQKHLKTFTTGKSRGPGTVVPCAFHPSEDPFADGHRNTGPVWDLDERKVYGVPHQ